MDNDIVLRVAQRYIQSSDLVVVTETNGKVVVSGPYPKMKELLTYLKGQKFAYNPSDKTWSIPKTQLTPLKLKNLEKRVTQVNGGATPQVEAPNQSKVHEEELRKLFEEALALKSTGFRFESWKDLGIQLSGPLTGLTGVISKAKGNILDKVALFSYKSTIPAEFAKILTSVKSFGTTIEQTQHKLSGLIPCEFHTLKVGMKIAQDAYLFVYGETYPHKGEIRDRLADAFFSDRARGWAAPLYSVSTKEVEKLIQYFTQAEQEKQAEHERFKQDRPQTKKRNQRPDNCIHCGNWVGPGEGFLVWDYSSEEGDFVWKVEHANKVECEAAREHQQKQQQILQEKARTRSQAVRSLSEFCEKPEHFVKGNHEYPAGTRVDITSRTYGKGLWLIIEPGETHFWFIRDNGSDGDDWSYNNLPGAIGYRLPMTEEAKILVEAIKGSSL